MSTCFDRASKDFTSDELAALQREVASRIGKNGLSEIDASRAVVQERLDASLRALSLIHETIIRTSGIKPPKAEPAILRAETHERFFSQLRKVFRDAPDKIFSTGEQVNAWVQANKGKLQIRDEELRWTGLTDWLTTRGKEKTSKADVVEYLAGNGVQVDETVLGAAEDTLKAKFKAEGYDIRQGEDSVDYIDPDGDMVSYDELPTEIQRIVDDAAKSYGDTKYAWKVPPGGIPGTYRETLLRLPRTDKPQYKYSVYGAFPREGFSTKEEADNYIDKLTSLSQQEGSEGLADSISRFPLRVEAVETRDSRKGVFTSGHWDQPNVLVHLRTDEVKGADGKRYLRVIEIQSDWGQKGKKEGFAGRTATEIEAELSAINRERSRLLTEAAELPDSEMEKFKAMNAHIKELGEKATALDAEFQNAVGKTTVPSAPFVTDTKAWVSLGVKRAIRQAIDSGMDGIVFATGQQNADLYSLSTQVKHIAWEKNDDGTYNLNAPLPDGSPGVYKEDLSISEVEDHVGKEIAKKIKAGDGRKDTESGGYREWRIIEGEGLTVGGEGMRAFYDEIVPQVTNKVLKQIGAGVKVGAASVGATKHPAVPITDAMRTKVRNEGMPLFSKAQPPMWSRGIPAAKDVSDFVSTLWKNDRSISPWMKTVGTQVHTAEVLAKEGKPEFKRVFDIGQDFIDDISTYALRAEALAPNLFPRFRHLGDVFRKIGAKKKDIAAIAKPLYEGTLDYRVWTDKELGPRERTDKELVDSFGLTATQIGLYHEARAAVNRSITDFAKSVIMQHAKQNGVEADSELGMAELSAEVQRGLAAKKTQENTQRIERTIADVKAVEEKLSDLVRQGYFPLMRFGEHTVTMRDKEGVVTNFGLFDSQFAANRAAEILRKDSPDQEVKTGILSKKAWKLYGGLNLDALVLFAEHMDASVLEPYQEYLRVAISNNNAMKRLLHRKDIPGFSENVEQTIAQLVTSNARHISALYHLGDMRRAVEAVPQGDIKDHAFELFNYLSEANEEAAALRGFLFFNYIGGSVASALTNLTQIPMTAAPYLTLTDHPGKVAKALISAAAMKRENATGELKAAWNKADEEGITAPQEIHQMTAQASNRLGSGSHTMQRALKAWGGMFEMAETFNREVTFVAAFSLAKNRGLKADAAYEFAKNAVEQTQFIYNKGNRPSWGRGAVGATIFTFKQFSISYLELLKRMPPKQRMMMLGMLMLAAGGEGEPFYDDITDLIDTLGQWMGYSVNTKRYIRENVKSVAGEGMGNFLLKGVSSVAPIDVQGRMSMANLLPGTSYFKQSSVDKGREALEIFGVVGSLIQNVGSAIENMAVGNMGGVIKSVAPVALKNAYQGAEMLNTGHGVDIKGRKTVDVSAPEAMAKMVGFSPESTAELGRRQRELMQDRNLQRVKEEEIVEMFVRGKLNNDPETVAKAYNKLSRWNKANPELPIRITPTQIRSRIIAAQTTSEGRFIKATAPEIRARIAQELRKE